MFGKNLKLGVEAGDGTTLKIHSIFQTLQGEGPYAGHQALFIRLSGCNLACTFCDTEFDSNYSMKVEDLIVTANASKRKSKLVVITGGEPLRQNINLLCASLLELGYLVQIESNGTIARLLPEGTQIVCSPKFTKNSYHRINDQVLQRTIAIKFLISAYRAGYNDIAEVGQKDFNLPVYLQPIDEYDAVKNKHNLELALNLAQQHGLIISLQLHKILGIE